MKATGLLVQFIAANGGRIHRGDLQRAVADLYAQGLVEPAFDHTQSLGRAPVFMSYDYALTDQGRAYMKNLEQTENGRTKGEEAE